MSAGCELVLPISCSKIGIGVICLILLRRRIRPLDSFATSAGCVIPACQCVCVLCSRSQRAAPNFQSCHSHSLARIFSFLLRLIFSFPAASFGTTSKYSSFPFQLPTAQANSGSGIGARVPTRSYSERPSWQRLEEWKWRHRSRKLS